MTRRLLVAVRAPAGEQFMASWRAGAVLFLATAIFFGARVLAQYRPLTYLRGDCPYYALTAISILHDRDLDLRNQLLGGLAIHGRQIAIGRDGEWFPKHPLLMPLAALPFFATLGVPGFLVFNIAVLAALAVVLMRLARSQASAAAASGAALLLLAGTFMRRFDYNFSPDLFATLILALALLALQRGRDAGAGLLFGLAVAARLTHLFLLPLGVLYAAVACGRRAGARAALGAAGPLLALAILNAALFGSPLVTSYDRNVWFEGGEAVMTGHRGWFDRPVLEGLRGEILDPEHGLLPTSPVLLLAIPGFVLQFRRRPLEALLGLAVAEFLILFFATYRYWTSSHYGNRFLMPVVAVAAAPVALALDALAAALRARVRAARRTGPAATPVP